MSNVYNTEPPTDGKVVLHTSCGDLEIELWPKQAPKACRNFIQLCMEGYYDNTIFHRVIKDFIVQGGDPTGTGSGGESIYGEPFEDEFHSRLRFSHRGLLAMASTDIDENTSQFFFTLSRADELNRKNTIFGKIVGDTIFNLVKISEVDTDEEDRPLYPVTLTSVDILSNPFEDIVPRSTAEERKLKALEEEEKRRQEEEAKKPKGKKNTRLLSFGEDEQEEQVDFKIKSSHDVLKQDRRLKQDTAVIEDKPKKKKKLIDNGEEQERKPPTDSQPMSRSQPAPVSAREKKMNDIKSEIEKMQKDIRKIKKQVDGEEEQEEQASRKRKSVSEGKAMLSALKSEYATRKDIKRKKGSSALMDEKDLLSKLDAFKSTIHQTAQVKPAKKTVEKVCKAHGRNNCKSCFEETEQEEGEEGWLGHTLVFEKEAANVYERKLDDYTYIDPRVEAQGGATKDKFNKVSERKYK